MLYRGGGGSIVFCLELFSISLFSLFFKKIALTVLFIYFFFNYDSAYLNVN